MRTAERVLRTVCLRAKMPAANMRPNTSRPIRIDVAQFGRQVLRPDDDAIVEAGGLAQCLFPLRRRFQASDPMDCLGFLIDLDLTRFLKLDLKGGGKS